MPVNTAYLSVNTSAQSNVNSPYILGGLAGFPSDISSNGTLFVNNQIVRGTVSSPSAASFGAITGTTGTFTSTLTVGGAATLSAASVRGLLDLQSARTQSGTLSYATTASAASTILPDGAFGIYFQSVSSCRLCYRSGSTTYTWIATTGGLL